MQPKIKSTLLEARKAYRFLYEYQKRILDLVSFIGGKFGLVYNGGYPKFSDLTPRNGKGTLERWSWDWLNLYFYEFNFMPENEDLSKLSFSVFLVNDTGYFEANNINGITKTNTQAFKPVEEAESKLILVVGENMWVGWGPNWDEPEFILQPFGEKSDENNGKMIFKHYNLEDFESEEKAMTCLKDFETHCVARGINFRIKINQLK